MANAPDKITDKDRAITKQYEDKKRELTQVGMSDFYRQMAQIEQMAGLPKVPEFAGYSARPISP